ncbi:hypothetical protein CcaverHIS002_0111740 [Cutaneotrichosporon cavernicola]|uniref:Uncharacterized protein n=1 Tax=Cutaneotrichosporon cavernicola TaxID=279322 RepID=A0AA48KZB1_9TREE|nr:uncharacterized protein CcaverHIS019_0111640 [Cutaneotrichosporon cavernicola]BEI80645.1 hypothetical protein CcaverHIS002_0111740 [Cutaneotrichosporon cavernicola]BEI88446.1 hypothetical protein CcaverHIS019_0111640 [Cutaneotrichosporon cavernicola]BEI96219.1 hypothetical protein CcaverHIS631_0111680 [Cutaneotrichosporon cavernicola]BEJ03990.1 hypothetical protein CcaverHIS641_0111650 [Cutaneotrichosporon cavernicola]
MQRDAQTNTRSLLSNLEHLRDSLSDRVEQLSTAVERLRTQATEIEAAVTGSSSSRPSHTTRLPLSDPVIELTTAMSSLSVQGRGLAPTNLARVAAAPKPIVVHGPERHDSDEEAQEPPTDQPTSIPDVFLGEGDGEGEEVTPPERWDWRVHTPRPQGLTTRGVLVRVREGANAETAQRPADRERGDRDRDRDRERDAREAERLDRAIARYQRRHDESQREFHNAWETERTRAVGGGRVPNEHSTARADALRRHVDNAHRLWHLMHQRARLAVPPTEPDAPLEMRHLLGTPSFRRGPLRPRQRPPRPVPVWPSRQDRDELFNEYYRDFTYDGESDEEELATQRSQVLERLERVRASAQSLASGEDRLRDLSDRVAERARGAAQVTDQSRELEARTDEMTAATRQLHVSANELAAAARQLGVGGQREPFSDLTPRVRVPFAHRIRDDRDPVAPWRARSPLVPRTLERVEDAHSERRANNLDSLEPRLTSIESERAGLRATMISDYRLSHFDNLEEAARRRSLLDYFDRRLDQIAASTGRRAEEDPGDVNRRALLTTMNSTLARLNEAARRPLGLRSDNEDVLERVERARERVAELSRIQRDLEAVRLGMRRGSDATVVPPDWTPGQRGERNERREEMRIGREEETNEHREEMSESVLRVIAVVGSDQSESESESEVEVDVATLAVFIDSSRATGDIPEPVASEQRDLPEATDDEDKETGTLSADTWPEGPSRAPPRPYVSLLDL